MIYGKRPSGMSDAEWMIECQCRYVARRMKEGATRQARLAIYEQWQKAMPGVRKARVAEIWKQGVPMPKGRSAA